MLQFHKQGVWLHRVHWQGQTHTNIQNSAVCNPSVCVSTSLDNSSYTTLISFIAAPREIARSGTVLSSLLQGQVFFQLSSSLLWPLKIMGLTITLLPRHVDACHLTEWQGNVIPVAPCAGSLVLIAASKRSLCWVFGLMLYLPELVSLHLCTPQRAAPVPQRLPCLRVFSQCVFPIASSLYPQLLAAPCEPSSLCGHFFSVNLQILWTAFWFYSCIKPAFFGSFECLLQ